MDFVHLLGVVVLEPTILLLFQILQLLEFGIKLVMPRVKNHYLEGKSTRTHNKADYGQESLKKHHFYYIKTQQLRIKFKIRSNINQQCQYQGQNHEPFRAWKNSTFLFIVKIKTMGQTKQFSNRMKQTPYRDLLASILKFFVDYNYEKQKNINTEIRVLSEARGFKSQVSLTNRSFGLLDSLTPWLCSQIPQISCPNFLTPQSRGIKHPIPRDRGGERLFGRPELSNQQQRCTWVRVFEMLTFSGFN